MICEICNKKKATVHLKQVINGLEKELFVCEDCSKEYGFEIPTPSEMSDFLFGIGVEKVKMPEPPEKSCPHCHMRHSDFSKRSRLGCSHCYETFADELQPMLKSMHKGMRHIGKFPVKDKVSKNIASLEKALAATVKAQNFEKAAEIRDHIRAIKKSNAVSRAAIDG